ncbi:MULTISPECIES: class I SAM-dependent RNA methyltransferase [Tsukamurella]|uniref:Class I SAM-dependent RNA methyltransferase n=2 Tax=Tsukamurella TaxID=2060 RepID=A0A5C5S0D7_9ACTN|nr:MULTISPECIES: TRAM domain-containing protein [Tsukamurella]NMD56065.1 class I SAM-dependent RNA methyltransferase [Tsukamurella columbiensis]TWS28829.1 class I SAM-dependent RNA methyltransferase [Tsukamurella conjunctivitidis]
MLQPNDVVELTCGAPGHGGFVVARHEGRAIFVRGALPDERVRARITEVKKSYARASTVEVLDASPHRVPEACSAAAAGAGCCDLTFADPAYQRELKASVLRDQLRRVGGFAPAFFGPEWDTVVQPLSDAPVAGWRHRARLVADGDGSLGQHTHRSDAVVVAPCAQLPDALTDLAAGLRAEPGTEVALVLDDAGAAHAAVPARRGRPAQVLAGDALAEYRVGARSWRIPVGGFWQAHRDAASRYAQWVGAYTSRFGGEPGRAWDLYGGAGVLAGALVDEGFAVDVVETSGGAIAAGKQTFAGAPVAFHRGDTASRIKGLPSPAVVVLDPPRTGAGAAVMAEIAAAEPRAIVHVGCDPAAFARDLGAACENGYRLAELDARDAFPGTHHLEAFAVLVPGREDRRGR